MKFTTTRALYLGILSAILFICQATVSNAQSNVVAIPIFSDNATSVNNVITVAEENADFDDIIEAMASIVDADTDNRYLIAIAPGTYPLSERLVMQEYVSVVGSGQQITTLTGSVSTQSSGTLSQAALIEGAFFSSISDLTVVNTDNGTFMFGIKDAANPPAPVTQPGGDFPFDGFTISNVNVLVEGAPSLGINAVVGVALKYGSAHNVKIEVHGNSSANVTGLQLTEYASVTNCQVQINGGSPSNGIVGIGENLYVNNVNIRLNPDGSASGISDLTFGGQGGTYSNIDISIHPSGGVGFSVPGSGGGGVTTAHLKRSTIKAGTALSGAADTNIYVSQSSLIAPSISGGLATTRCIASDNGNGSALSATPGGNCANPLIP